MKNMRYHTTMFRAFTTTLFLATLVTSVSAQTALPGAQTSYSDSEDGFGNGVELEETALSNQSLYLDMHNRYSVTQLENWKRPDGPIRIGIQSGHLESENVPDELPGVRRNRTGAKYKKLIERNIVYAISLEVKKQLEKDGFVVDIIPATVPPGYTADAFVSIHADGNPNPTKRGFKVAHPRRDYSQEAHALESALHSAYGEATHLPVDEQVTTNMRGYYACNWQRYTHAVHPKTPCVIIEAGFVSNALDRAVISQKPILAATGIANGVRSFIALKRKGLLPPPPPIITARPVKGKPICLNDHLYGNIKTPNCVLGIETKDARQYALEIPKTLPTSRMLTASAVSVAGTFSPISERRNYPWYIYDVDGVLQVQSLQ